VKAERDAAESCADQLAALARAADGTDNLMPR
jgi:hypothetical protein